MVSATVLFLPGWEHHSRLDSTTTDPVTGEPIKAPMRKITGRGLVQEALWSSSTEVTSTSVVDERLVLFEPPAEMADGFEISVKDEFFSPEGHCWQATTDGRPRGIPGHPPDYYATRVRRAKEKDR